MLRLFLIRHGETIWNQNHRYQGHTDVPLSKTGEWQAGLVAKRLKDEPLDAVFSSDLSRARVTAEIIAREHGLTVTSLPFESTETLPPVTAPIMPLAVELAALSVILFLT